MNRRPLRIVSLAPSNTEILFALDLEKEIVGVTELCNYPPQAMLREKVGGFLEPQVHMVKALHPDAVLACEGIHDPVVKELRQEGLTVWVINPKTVEEVFESIDKIGILTDKASFAQELTFSLRGRVEGIKQKVGVIPGEERPRTLRAMSYNPLIIAGPGSVQYDAIAVAGGKNMSLPNLPAFPSITQEALRDFDPEVIITCDWKREEVAEGLKKWQGIAAIRSNRVHSLPCGISCRPGPRVVELVEKIAGFLYPHLFGRTHEA